jgi:hypothetical protein
MTNEQITTMTQYYEKRYGKPEGDVDSIEKLCTIYGDLFGEVAPQPIRDGIGEYFRILSSRELPAYLWILEALHVTSKKEKSKRTFSYCVGMLRSWMKYGFGHIPNQEEDELVEYFEEVTGLTVTVNARRVLQKLLGTYGVVKVTRMINELRNNKDMAFMMMLQLEVLMQDTFEPKEGTLNQPITNEVLVQS